jgi:hypothetical protein
MSNKKIFCLLICAKYVEVCYKHVNILLRVKKILVLCSRFLRNSKGHLMRVNAGNLSYGDNSVMQVPKTKDIVYCSTVG